MLHVGAKAPDFTAVLDDGSQFNLAEALAHGPVVLYFYPKDFTAGCTREACAFRDHFEDITTHGATLIGVSADSTDSHTRFREAHNLPFPLIADGGKDVIDAYDARGLFGLSIARITYVIDTAGIIRGAFRHDLLVTRHVPLVIETLDAMSRAASST